MIPFSKIHDEARARHGRSLQRSLPEPESAAGLRRRPDADYLSLMSRRIFRAGLRHSMVDARWPAFEEAFFGFDIERVSLMSDEELEALMGNRQVIRHWGKLKSVRYNAAGMDELREEYGGAGHYLAAWPQTDIVGLWLDLKKRFAQMGGNSGPYFLRMAGKDTFLLTGDVIKALNRWGVYAGMPTSGKARRAVQAAFNEWREETGEPLCRLSRILACSVD